MDNNLTTQLEQWLDTSADERDYKAGAILLLQLSNNPIMYRNISMNPKGKAEFIEGKLRQYLADRKAITEHEETAALQLQANEIMDSHTEYKEETNEAKDFKAGKIRANESQDELAQSRPSAAEFRAGKRADHDTLPDEIKALYVENLDITHRMRELHLKLRSLSGSTQLVSDAERKPLLTEFINLDKKLHDNWNTYDHYVANEEKEETAKAETETAEEQTTTKKTKKKAE